MRAAVLVAGLILIGGLLPATPARAAGTTNTCLAAGHNANVTGCPTTATAATVNLFNTTPYPLYLSLRAVTYVAVSHVGNGFRTVFGPVAPIVPLPGASASTVQTMTYYCRTPTSRPWVSGLCYDTYPDNHTKPSKDAPFFGEPAQAASVIGGGMLLPAYSSLQISYTPGAAIWASPTEISYGTLATDMQLAMVLANRPSLAGAPQALTPTVAVNFFSAIEAVAQSIGLACFWPAPGMTTVSSQSILYGCGLKPELATLTASNGVPLVFIIRGAEQDLPAFNITIALNNTTSIPTTPGNATAVSTVYPGNWNAVGGYDTRPPAP